MEAAIFGLIGVVVGGLITTSATYFMERRKGWTEARGAGLLLHADLGHAIEQLKNGTDFTALAKVVETAWPERRAALLFRAGTFPSGLNADEWLKLDETFTALEFAVRKTDRHKAVGFAKEARETLEVFRPDRPALIQSFRKLLRLQEKQARGS
jgi:hypothetical protein